MSRARSERESGRASERRVPCGDRKKGHMVRLSSTMVPYTRNIRYDTQHGVRVRTLEAV